MATQAMSNCELFHRVSIKMHVSMRIALCRSPRKFNNQHVRLRTIFIGQHRDDDDDQNKGNATKHNLVQHRAPADA